jgi:L-ribulose-5-phosphate 3-epimerase
MNHHLNRREFLTMAAGAGLGLGLGAAPAWAQAEPAFTTKLHKAVISNCPSEAELQKLKNLGFEGVEGGIVSVAEAEKCRASAEKLGMRIHSVLRGWAEFNSPKPDTVQATLKTTEDALLAAHAFGADAVLLVPCRIGGMKMPKPLEFQIEFDEKTGLISKVAAGDNAPYADYIKAHNHAVETSAVAIKKLIPLAEKTKVIIALENVWNNLWVKPAIFRQFVASFESPWVKAYFDIGNHVKYAPPEEWILTLGKLVAKLHAKDFKLNDDRGGGGGFVAIRDGSVNWPAVRAALEKVGYNGWLTMEDGRVPLEEQSKRLDLILAGK